MGKVARNVRNSMRQEDAHYAQKVAVNTTVIGPVIVYRSLARVLRKAEQNLLERTEMRMLR